MVVIGRDFAPGPWQSLFVNAMDIMDKASAGYGKTPFFTFGGGTVLMLRYLHRESNDIDLFVENSDFLSYASPRLNDRILTDDYVEAGSSLKFFFDAGEVDIVAAPNLLPEAHAYETWSILGHEVRVESAGEIIAKKMFHRGSSATPRDLFDLALVLEKVPTALAHAGPFMARHREAFIKKIEHADDLFAEKFAAIKALDYTPALQQAISLATAYLSAL